MIHPRVVALLTVCAVAVAVLIWADYRQRATLRASAKLTASAAFVSLGLLTKPELASSMAPVWPWIMLGLVLGAVGDAALLSERATMFLIGLVVFLMGHLAYVVGFSRIAYWPPNAVGWAAIIAVCLTSTLALRWLWPHLGSMRVAVMAYIGVISAMVVAAALLSQSAVASTASNTLAVVGSLLFYVSDLAVARDKFVVSTWKNRAWGLPAYFAGQCCIALAMGQ